MSTIELIASVCRVSLISVACVNIPVHVAQVLSLVYLGGV